MHCKVNIFLSYNLAILWNKRRKVTAKYHMLFKNIGKRIKIIIMYRLISHLKAIIIHVLRKEQLLGKQLSTLFSHIFEQKWFEYYYGMITLTRQGYE